MLAAVADRTGKWSFTRPSTYLSLMRSYSFRNVYSVAGQIGHWSKLRCRTATDYGFDRSFVAPARGMSGAPMREPKPASPDCSDRLISTREPRDCSRELQPGDCPRRDDRRHESKKPNSQPRCGAMRPLRMRRAISRAHVLMPGNFGKGERLTRRAVRVPPLRCLPTMVVAWSRCHDTIKAGHELISDIPPAETVVEANARGFPLR